MRCALRVPSRSTKSAIDTLSTESRFTADRSGTGSSPGSKMTSLGNSRMVVVQGATNARPRRGMATSRDRTTTGRRPMSGSSHHHSSPRRGMLLTWPLPPNGTRPGRPSRQAHRAGVCHMRCRQHRFLLRGGAQAGLAALHRATLHRLCRLGCAAPRPTSSRRQWCSLEPVPCHDYATCMPCWSKEWEQSTDGYLAGSATPMVMSRSPAMAASRSPMLRRVPNQRWRPWRRPAARVSQTRSPPVRYRAPMQAAPSNSGRGSRISVSSRPGAFAQGYPMPSDAAPSRGFSPVFRVRAAGGQPAATVSPG